MSHKPHDPRHGVGTPSHKFKILLLTFNFLLLTLSAGCDAFVRKFTRKSKKEDLPKEEMVLAPEEYKGPNMTKEEIYRQYLLYWKSWQDELLAALLGDSNYKKQVGCVKEAIKNLQQLKTMLDAQMQKKFDTYINQMESLKSSIVSDLYSNDLSQNRLGAERIRRGILRDFSYDKIKDHLI